MALTPREITRATQSFSTTISIVNPSVSFSLTATINGNIVVFLVDTGSALTILRKDTWERCKQPEQQLAPWSQKKLVGVEGSFLQVFGSATVTVDVQGEELQLAVVVIDPLTTEAILGLDVLTQCTVDLLHNQLITGAGHVVTLNFQEPNMKVTTDLVGFYDHETVNSESVGDHLSQQDFTSDPVTNQVLQEPLQTKTLLQSEFMTSSPMLQKAVQADNGLVDGSKSQEVCHVLSAQVVENVRVPSYSEMEILLEVKGCTPNNSSCYVLESNLQNSDIMVARALVTPNEFVPVRLLNPTGESIVLYSGANVAVMSEISEVTDDGLVPVSVISQLSNDHDCAYSELGSLLLKSN